MQTSQLEWRRHLPSMVSWSTRFAIDFLRPGLEVLLKTYLKIMDDIDFDELVQALQLLVNVYHDEIAPYAVSLC